MPEPHEATSGGPQGHSVPGSVGRDGTARSFERPPLAVHLDGTLLRARTMQVRGEADHASSPALVAAFAALAEDGCTTVTIDCSGLTYLDCSGVRALASGRLATAFATITLVAPPPAVRRLLDAIGLLALVEVIP